MPHAKPDEISPDSLIEDSLIDDDASETLIPNINAAQLHQQVLASNQDLSEDVMENTIAQEDYSNSGYQNGDYQDPDQDEHEYDYSELALAAHEAMQLQTIRDFIRFNVTQLRKYDVIIAQGTNDVFAEASAIVLHTLMLEWSADDQILDCRLTTTEKNDVLVLLQQRIMQRQPLSYLINLAYFCGLPFYVDERVLIPRSPIAELIRQQFHPYYLTNELAQPVQSVGQSGKTQLDITLIDFFDHGLAHKGLMEPQQILDLCTGSGCIAVALASRFVDAQVDATDIDKAALEVAGVNVEHHDLGHQINIIESDLFAKIPAESQYELIVTNPPYVDAAAMAELPPEFLYEPEHALAAGQDGLDLVHKILYEAPDYMSEDGLLVCEVGDSEWALRQAYPTINFNWLTFAFGGSGVFAIDRQALLKFRTLFAEQIATLIPQNTDNYQN